MERQLNLEACDVTVFELHEALKAKCEQCGWQEKDFFMCM